MFGANLPPLPFLAKFTTTYFNNFLPQLKRSPLPGHQLSC